MLSKAKKFLLDLFYPKFCFLCQREGSYLCQDCQATLEISNTHQKADLEWLSDLYFTTDYQKPLIKNLIKRFKYEPFVKELANSLASLIIEHFSLVEKQPDYNPPAALPLLGPLNSNSPTTLTPPPSNLQSEFVLIPIPLDKKRLKWRGFNQTEEIGKELAKFFQIPLLNNVLAKIKETPPQVELSDEERKENVKGAFLVKDEELIKNKKILLVDDVYTTGSTMEECARVLKKAGTREIIGIVVARG